MHLLAAASTSIDELVEPIDLRQAPADLAVLSFADSDLSGLAAAWLAEQQALPTLRLVHLRDLRHPMSVDLWIDGVGRHAKAIVVRLLGGLDWWRYGIERLSALAREQGIALAVLPGEDRDDTRLTEASTLPACELEALLQYFRTGGPSNMRSFLHRLACHAGCKGEAPAPRPMPPMGAYASSRGAIEFEELIAALPPGAPVIPIIFYRAALLASDTAPIDTLAAALAARGLAPAPLFVTSLKDSAAKQFLRNTLPRLDPAVVVTTTAFAAGGDGAEPSALELTDAPVLQVVIAITKRAAWRDSARGLGASDLAMHVVLPEIDGRILAGAISFKEAVTPIEGLGFAALINRPEPDRVAAVADRVAAIARLRATPRGERRIAVLMPDYPGAGGRTGYAVGLDVPASTVALLMDLAAAGYTVTDAPLTSALLLDAVQKRWDLATLPVDDYLRLRACLPPDVLSRIDAAWGNPTDDPDVYEGAFHFRAHAFGNVIVGLAPDRGSRGRRRADYHDATLPPRHALLAFGLWLRREQDVHALVHMGAHGTLEWLPGKAVALTSSCFPELVVGPLPVIYPFIVSNPGEAAQAKRRIGAVTIGHLPPPLVPGDCSGPTQDLERLVDEYAQADGLDPRRRGKLASLIVETACRSGVARDAGVNAQDQPDEALRRIDAWLCDLKELAIKDGLHVYGRTDGRTDTPEWTASAAAERASLIAALDGRRVTAGPAGAPSRGRRDVLPTGRNLFTADPRMLPTPTAVELGRLAADEVIRNYVQTHGEMPRALVLDLWGSATLRTGGEEVATGLWFMGCRPTWDNTTGRITGVEVLSTAIIGRPRIDVSWRISGLFRDLFPAQIAIMDAAVQAIAAREEDADENPLASARRQDAPKIARIFSTAPGAYGAGVEHSLGGKADRQAIGEAYLEATSFAYGGADGEGTSEPGGFARRITEADLLVHSGDDPGRDLLEGEADVAFIGGFSAAAAALGRTPDLLVLDTTDPQRPRARPLAAALSRIVHARALNPRFISGQMRHGQRGAAEFAETVDRLVAFAETTDAVRSELIDLVYEAYVVDPSVREFLLAENRPAALAIAERLQQALRGGHWHPRRNDVHAHLSILQSEAPS